MGQPEDFGHFGPVAMGNPMNSERLDRWTNHLYIGNFLAMSDYRMAIAIISQKGHLFCFVFRFLAFPHHTFLQHVSNNMWPSQNVQLHDYLTIQLHDAKNKKWGLNICSPERIHRFTQQLMFPQKNNLVVPLVVIVGFH